MDFFGCLKKHEIEEIKKKQKELIWILFVIKKKWVDKTRIFFVSFIIKKNTLCSLNEKLR